MAFDLQRLENELRQFAAYSNSECARQYAHEGREHSFHLVFCALTHGDEVGSLPAFNRIVGELQSGELQFGGHASWVLGNPEAGLKNRRFLEADLNRVFVDLPPSNHEGERAKEMMSVLRRADLFVDFHQTIMPTLHPFYIGPWSQEMECWTTALSAAKLWITRAPGASFSASSTVCADEFVRQNQRLGITLELSQKGFSTEAEARCYQCMRDAMVFADTIAKGGSIENISKNAPPLEYIETVYKEPFASPSHALIEDLYNFQTVSNGEILSKADSPRIVVPQDAYLLFPKYPERKDGDAIPPYPKDIFNLGVAMQKKPSLLWGKDL